MAAASGEQQQQQQQQRGDDVPLFTFAVLADIQYADKV